ncbi:MAG: hypothetical protein MK230_05245 [Candidatus Marinimicrobia bacterium]|uniref:Uncharacterized protein n=1 Tax=marine metagenome TaxID=408172 RepID=A0A382I931_9ZZZZ|nr:hypothetical protein [Candidatus Neomarinimicrobiota bacterium]|tara:strand:- start:139 stop:558 length:420 start_codon:yes stop_codon:yes gene_type:complete
MSIERRINSLKGRSHESGDAESFLTNLKGEIIQRDRRRQNIINSVSGLIVALAMGVGIYINNPTVDSTFATVDVSEIIIDLSDQPDSITVFDDEEFIVASMDYLIGGTELISTGWSIIEDLSLYNYLETGEKISQEERS